jgi:hypothetical protein
MVYALQCVYSWLLPFREQPAVARLRQQLLRRARMHVIQDNDTEAIKTRSDD